MKIEAGLMDYENVGLKLIPTYFEYLKVVEGIAMTLPGLYSVVEAKFPDHQRIIAGTLTNFHLWAYTIRFAPMQHLESGFVTHPKWGMRIVGLNALAPKYTIMETLYHEIFHVLLPNESEDVIEEMGVTFASLMQGRFDGYYDSSVFGDLV